MDPHPDDVTSTGALALVEAARHGDRLAFGVLYLRHHAAAWRIACVASRFSPDAELAVIEGFTRVFSALPQDSEEFRTGGGTFRPYVLACVRQAALDRARAAGRAERAAAAPASPHPPASLAGLGPDGEVVLSTLEHHVARGALAALPERSRTALWLFDVEAMTPAEVAGILGGRPQEVAALAAAAGTELRAAQQATLGRHEVRAGCRFTADHLDAYRAGTLDPTDGLIVRSHLDRCPPCRMRQGELADAPGALAAAVPAAPLLGGEAQHHWLTSAADLRPADRLLPPGLAAGGVVPRTPLARRAATRLGATAGAATAPARRLPDALRRAGRAATGSWRPQPAPIDLAGPTSPDGSSDPMTPPGWTGAPGSSGSPTPSLPPAWTIPPGRAGVPFRRRRRAERVLALAGAAPVLTGRLPAFARRATRTLWPALPAASLAVAWVVVMLALPWLMTPGTAPGPGGMALPAVQAYVPDFLPGAAPAGHGRGSGAAPLAGWGGTELAVPAPGAAGRVTAASTGATTGDLALGLIPNAGPRPSRPDVARHHSPVSVGAAPPIPIPILPAPAVIPVAVAATTAPAPTLTVSPATVTPTNQHSRSGKHARKDRPETIATVPDRPGPTTDGRSGRRSTRRQAVPRGRIVTA